MTFLDRVQMWLYCLTLVVLMPLLLPHWFMCRMTSRRCPKCKSKWRTELHSEWGTELWVCHACDNVWHYPEWKPESEQGKRLFGENGERF